MEQLVFTPASLLDLLSQIEELADKDINVTEFGDGSVEISIGDSTYTISASNAEDVTVTEEVLQDVEEINNAGYEELGEDVLENIEGGILKTVAKALLLRGLIKLSTKLLD